MNRVSAFVFVACVTVVNSVGVKPEATYHPRMYCGGGFDCSVGDKMVRHTMCSFDEKPFELICQNQKSILTEEDKKWILGAHNAMRDLMARGNVDVGWTLASNMRQITWDDELAMYAKRWAFQCRSGTDYCRQHPQFGDHVGQNEDGPRHARERPDFKDSVSSWFREFNHARKANVENFNVNDPSRNFFLMMWADVFKIGCALIEFDVYEQDSGDCRVMKPEGCTDFYRHKGIRLVCNYAPAYMDRKVWIAGQPCTRCPKGTACNDNSTYPHLCAVANDPENETPFVLRTGATAVSQKSQAGVEILLAVGLAAYAYA